MTMWYSYTLLNPLKPSALHRSGFEPFYVGKGKNDRHLVHTQQVKRGLNEGNMHKINVIRQILSTGVDPIVCVESTFLVEQEAFDHEKFLIKSYGRADLQLGPLTNLTDGGEGPSNRIFSDQHKLRLSVAQKKAIADGRAEISTAFREAGLRTWHTPEARLKSAEKRTGREIKQTTKDAIGTGQSKFAASLNADQRKAHYGTMTGKKHSESALLKMSESVKAALSLPETKARRSAVNSGANNPRAKACELLGVRYDTVVAASVASGWNRGKVRTHPSFRYLA